MKRKYWNEFMLRGVLFGGLGCIVVALVHLIIDWVGVPVQVDGTAFFCATLTGYLLGFAVAGASVFYQIESWGLAKATLLHLLLLYAAYLGAYLLNTWLPRDWVSVGIFTGIFVVGYLVIWGAVVAAITITAKKLNGKLPKEK